MNYKLLISIINNEIFVIYKDNNLRNIIDLNIFSETSENKKISFSLLKNY